MKAYLWTVSSVALSALLTSTVAFAGPKIVSGPGANPECFKPWSDTKFFQWAKKPGPYKIALVNGFVGNTWRIQMVKTAKAFAEQPEHQGGHQGVQGRLDRHRRRRATRRHGGLHQSGLRRDRHHRGRARRLRPHHPPRRQEQRRRRALRQHPRHRQGDDGQRGPEGNGPHVGQMADRRNAARRPAISSKCAACPAIRSTATAISASARSWRRRRNKFNITEVVGNWDTGTSQKVTADALAVHGHFDGVFTQGGDDGTVQAMMDAKHPFVPMSPARARTSSASRSPITTRTA